ncbi:hypothetical protein L228DRAFT_129763 [Xylona heveae TC161]|uniref:SAC3/GANP/THP3 conserved domain-containing protein n=1 Tax=Xylona heveae (strain CBS 132557 / TC161) TaxID=1328760 RepID=A0A165GUJ0_XYLHT|nr:hypothetical protein L228DRAFT_129763 [Xylona heveae TC161]KZF22611.1 hypothetical protein L228DRAFT_129763 [Xylona heveae TC161]
MLADPTKAMSLADAITPVGTCQDMCAEFERVERIVQNEVKGPEKITAGATNRLVPCEDLMVKKFRRSAAGHDEQLPSDIRPPHVLKKTLDYLFHDVVGNCERLGDVHHFVWDRTRAVRNDFSIQQLTKAPDVRIAIECYERIARFHILSLHHLSIPGNAYAEYTNHQEQEQLDKTLLSLMYYYDDSRGILESPNEAEFRAYCIIFQIRERCPDTEERAQRWPKEIFWDPRVQRALKIYAAATSVVEEQGPLQPYTGYSVAQGNYGRFWSTVGSQEISYLMACVAEIYFNHVRKAALSSIMRAYKQGGHAKTEDWTLNDLVPVLGFDDDDEVRIFCEAYGLTISERADNEEYLEIGPNSGRDLLDPNPPPKQFFSRSLVEKKRYGRTLSSVINGMTAIAAEQAGMIDEAAVVGDETMSPNKNDSLFVTEDSEDEEPLDADASDQLDAGTEASVMSSALNPFAVSFKPTEPVANLARSSAGDHSSEITSPLSNPLSAPHSSAISSNPFGSTPTAKSSTSPLNFSSPAVSDPLNKAKAPSPLSNPFQPMQTWQPSVPKSPSGSINPFAAGFSSVPAPRPFAGALFGKLDTSQITTATQQPPSLDTTSEGNGRQVPSEPSSSKTTSYPTPFTSGLSTAAPTAPVASPSSIFDPHRPQVKSSSTPLAISQTAEVSNTPAFQDQPPSPFKTSTSPSFVVASEKRQHSSPLSTSRPPLTERSYHSTLFQSNCQSNDIDDASPGSPASIKELDPLNKHVAPTESQYVRRRTENGPQKPSRPDVGLAVGSTERNPDQGGHDLSRKAVMDKTLDQIASSLFLESYGLLEQLVEHTIGPIIRQAQAHMKNEAVMNEADAFRRNIVARRYVKRWREICWKLRLLRKSKERRQRFAEDAKLVAREKRRRSETPDNVISLLQKPLVAETPSRSLQKSTVDLLSQKSTRPLTYDLTKQKGSLESKSSQHPVTRPRAHLSPTTSASGVEFSPERISVLGHRGRRSTISSISSTNAPLLRSFAGIRKENTAPFNRSLQSLSFLSGDSLLSSSVIARARKLVPENRPAKQDTTQAPYFKMKALGLDPNVTLSTSQSPSRLSSPLSFSQQSPSNTRSGARDHEKSIPHISKPAILSTSFSPSSPSFLRMSQNTSNGPSKKRSREDRECENGKVYETVGMEEAIAAANETFNPCSTSSSGRDNDHSPAKSSTNLGARKMAKLDFSAPKSTGSLPPFPGHERQQTTALDDEDEQLFAQMRGVREAMDDTIRFFQEESARNKHDAASVTGQETNYTFPVSATFSTTPIAKTFQTTQGTKLSADPLISSTPLGEAGDLFSRFTRPASGSDLAEREPQSIAQRQRKGKQPLRDPPGFATAATELQKQQEEKSGISMDDAIEL